MDTERTSGSTPTSQSQPRAQIRLSSPADVLAVVPHMLGFHPASSLVVIGAGGRRGRVQLGFRYDLPDPPDRRAAADIAQHAAAVLSQREAGTVIVVGYGPGALVTPVVDALMSACETQRLTLREALRVEGGRYWSYLCSDVRCCPPDGAPFDLATHPAAAAMAAAGMPALADRQARAAAVAPAAGEMAKTMDEAAGRACDRASALMREARRQRRRDPRSLVISAGRDAVQQAVATYRDGGQIADADAIAWLAVTMTHLAVRDDAWARMAPEHREAHLRLWTDVVRRVGDLWTPGPAALLAFTAWQCGDGVLANLAIERALAADPAYSMALLLRDVLEAGVPPSAARAPMTPEEVAESYEQADHRPPAAEGAEDEPSGPASGRRQASGRGGGQRRQARAR